MSDGQSTLRRGMRWATVAQVGKLCIQLSGILILSRLLPPADFGLMSMAMVISGLANLLRDMGMASAIIQRDSISSELLSTIFWTSVIFGTGVGVLVASGSSAVAELFKAPNLAPVLVAMAIVFPITSAGSAHQAILERRSDFRSIAAVEIASASLGLIAAISSALYGLGALSFALQQIVTSLASLISLRKVSGFSPCRTWSLDQLRSIWRYSSALSAFNIVNYFARNADNFLIGRYLGATELGLYSMAYRIMLLPIQNVSTSISRALFPSLSRAQNDLDALRKTYLSAIQIIAYISAPLMAGLWVLSDQFVALFFDEKWAKVAELLMWLAPVGFYQSISTTLGVLYQATGHARPLFATGTVVSAAFVVAIWLGLPSGTVGVVSYYAIAHLIIFLPLFGVPFHLVGIKFYDLFASTIKPTTSAIIMSGVLVGVRIIWPGLGTSNNALGFITQVSLGAIFYSLAITTMTPQLFKHAIRRRHVP
ncbi:MAG: lipopolysaccharide biosynthesis protein [Nevskia sp.]|jgi:PST family polysaccharide transporter|nr:lipopolysaccharide biosynthesis protein [Nevskia sp.]MCK9386370.1 lipopolysaccharide biosynthesis protein [Nevskia sp.]